MSPECERPPPLPSTVCFKKTEHSWCPKGLFFFFSYISSAGEGGKVWDQNRDPLDPDPGPSVYRLGRNLLVLWSFVLETSIPAPPPACLRAGDVQSGRNVGWRSVSQPRRLLILVLVFTEKPAMQKRQIGNKCRAEVIKARQRKSPLSHAPNLHISLLAGVLGRKRGKERQDETEKSWTRVCLRGRSKRERREREGQRTNTRTMLVVIILERQDPVVATLCVNPNRIGQKYARVWGEGGVYR